MREVKFLGKLPDPFAKEDGTRMTAAQWQENKEAIRNQIVDIEFGGMPPRPEFVDFECLNDGVPGRVTTWYRVKAGKKDRYVTFYLEIMQNKSTEKSPVLLTGDACYMNLERDTIEEALKRGYAVARFNRLELADDRKERKGPLFDLYPEHPDVTAISAWAWGYSVCMDVLEKLSYTDETEVGITGHSRGGKTVMLAASVDERIKYVCPNNSGCHGAVSHRCVVTKQGDNENERSERISDMIVNFPTWMGPKLWAYADREEQLPYDMHYFGALIAPRYYLQCEGMQDYWINPIGAWQNFCAVKACYRYLGCEEHAGAWFREGMHRQKFPDIVQFLDFMDRARNGLPLAEHLCINPYPQIEKNFDW